MIENGGVKQLVYGAKVINKNEAQEIHPAMVDFELDAEPITWEQQIEKNRLLTEHENGPILPKFIKKDLSKYAV